MTGEDKQAIWEFALGTTSHVHMSVLPEQKGHILTLYITHSWGHTSLLKELRCPHTWGVRKEAENTIAKILLS